MSIDSLVNSYQESSNDVYDSVSTRVVSMRLNILDTSFIQAVSDHYKISRATFLQDLLAASLMEFFSKLPPSVQLSIGNSAHELFLLEGKKIAEENNGSFQFVGLSKWLFHAKVLSGEIKFSESGELISHE